MLPCADSPRASELFLQNPSSDSYEVSVAFSLGSDNKGMAEVLLEFCENFRPFFL